MRKKNYFKRNNLPNVVYCQDKFADGAKKTLQGGVQLVSEGAEKVFFVSFKGTVSKISRNLNLKRGVTDLQRERFRKSYTS